MITNEDKAAIDAHYAEVDFKAADGKQVPCTMDAMAWAKCWTATLARHPDIPNDEDTMLGWFANAIMAGYDTAASRSAEEIAALKAKIDRARAALLRAQKMGEEDGRSASSTVRIQDAGICIAMTELQ